MSRIQERSYETAERILGALLSAVTREIVDLSVFLAEVLMKALAKKERLRELFFTGGEMTLNDFQKSLKDKEPFSTVRIDDHMLEDCKRFMTEQKMGFVVIDDTESQSHCVLFKKADVEKMREALKKTETLHLNKGEIDAGVFLDIREGKSVGFATNLSREEAEIFRYFMAGSETPFAIATNERGLSMIMYDAESKDRIREAIDYTDWALRGSYGPLVLEQIRFRIQGRDNVVQAIEDAKQEYCIVSKNNPGKYVEITEDKVTYYKNNKAIDSVMRDNPNFEMEAWRMVESIGAPVLMKAEVFPEDLAERQVLLDNSMTLDFFPAEMQVMEEMKKYNKLRDIASYKMSMDNENQGDWALYAESVSFSEYTGREEMLDDDQWLKQDFEQMKGSINYSSNAHTYDEVVLEDKSVDGMIKRAEQAQNEERSGGRAYNKEYDR